MLNSLSLLGFPLISLPGGGIYITARQSEDGTSEDFGLRLLLDLQITGGSSGSAAAATDDDQGSSVALDLALGSWLTGESDCDNWMSRSGGSAPSYAPGVSVFFITRDTTNNTLSFAPGFSLVSIGVNITSATDKPLVNIEGVTFGGTDLRLFLDPGEPMLPPADWNYGFAIRLDTLGFPLAPDGGSGDGGNPVAQNFLSGGSNSSGGDSGSGSDSEPVNPAFSVAVAWRSDSTNSPKINVELFGSEGTPAGTSAVSIPVQRSFGPLTGQRIGIAFDEANDCRLTVLFDGDVAVGPLAVDLIDLSIGIPLSAPLDLDEYTLGLHGMSVAYTSAPLSIMGGMDEDTTVAPVEYNGELLIQAAAWAIYAIGSYASLNGHPSLFVFARLSAPIGGPAFWAPAGVRPVVQAQIVRQYEYVYGAVSPHDGVLDILVLPEVHTEAMGVFLADVAQRHSGEFIVMVLDGAGWHKAKHLPVPDNLRLVPLPPWSPELNSAEHIWDEIREKWFGNRLMASMDQVEQQLVTGLSVLEADPPRVASLTGFDWITCVPLKAN